MYSTGMCFPMCGECRWRAPAVRPSDERGQRADRQPTDFLTIALELMAPHGTVAASWLGTGNMSWYVADKWVFMTNWGDFTLVLLSLLSLSGVTLCPVINQKTSCCCAAARILDLIYCWLFDCLMKLLTLQLYMSTLNGTTCRKVLVIVMLMLRLKQYW